MIGSGERALEQHLRELKSSSRYFDPAVVVELSTLLYKKSNKKSTTHSEGEPVGQRRISAAEFLQQ